MIAPTYTAPGVNARLLVLSRIRADIIRMRRYLRTGDSLLTPIVAEALCEAMQRERDMLKIIAVL